MRKSRGAQECPRAPVGYDLGTVRDHPSGRREKTREFLSIHVKVIDSKI